MGVPGPTWVRTLLRSCVSIDCSSDLCGHRVRCRPEPARCHARALDQCAQFGPLNRGMHTNMIVALGEAAVRPRNDVVATDDARKILDAPRDQFRMFDNVRAMGDKAGNERLAVLQPDLL